jgi:hypothetical protein
VYRAIFEQRMRAEIGEAVVVVHGHCPTGADHWADLWASETLDPEVSVERHPADWSRGKRGGPERNARMVAAGADVCLAFPLPGSRGTVDCMRKAQAAGIPVLTVEAGT